MRTRTKEAIDVGFKITSSMVFILCYIEEIKSTCWWLCHVALMEVKINVSIFRFVSCDAIFRFSKLIPVYHSIHYSAALFFLLLSIISRIPCCQFFLDLVFLLPNTFKATFQCSCATFDSTISICFKFVVMYSYWDRHFFL